MTTIKPTPPVSPGAMTTQHGSTGTAGDARNGRGFKIPANVTSFFKSIIRGTTQSTASTPKITQLNIRPGIPNIKAPAAGPGGGASGALLPASSPGVKIPTAQLPQIVRSPLASQPAGGTAAGSAIQIVQTGTQKVAESANGVAVELVKNAIPKVINRTLAATSKEAQQFARHEGRLDSVTSPRDVRPGTSAAVEIKPLAQGEAASNGDQAVTQSSGAPVTNNLPAQNSGAPVPTAPPTQSARTPGSNPPSSQAETILNLQHFTRRAAHDYIKAQFGLNIDPASHYLVQFQPSPENSHIPPDLRLHGAGDISRQISLLDLMNDGYGKPASSDMASARGRYGIYSQQAIARGDMITADKQDLAGKRGNFSPSVPMSAAEAYAGTSLNVLSPKALIDRMRRPLNRGGYTVQRAFNSFLNNNMPGLSNRLMVARVTTGLSAADAAYKDKSIQPDDRAIFATGLGYGSGPGPQGSQIEVAPFALGKQLSSNGLRIATDDRVTYYLPGEERPLRSFDSDASAWNDWLGPMLSSAGTADGFLARQFPNTGFAYREYQRQHSPQADTFGPRIVGNPVLNGIKMRLSDMRTEVLSSYDKGVRGMD